MQVPLAPLPGPITSLLMPGQLSDLEAASSRAVAWAAVLTGPAQEARRGVHRARRLAARPANLAGQPGAVRRTVMRSRTREGTSANAATGTLGPALADDGPAAQALTELAAQPVKIAQNPGAGQPPGIRHEEGCRQRVLARVDAGSLTPWGHGGQTGGQRAQAPADSARLTQSVCAGEEEGPPARLCPGQGISAEIASGRRGRRFKSGHPDHEAAGSSSIS